MPTPTPRTVLSSLLCLTLTVAAVVSLPRHATAGPNVILIVADDLGYGDTRLTDPSAVVATPHIMSIANQGVKFTNGYVASPVCSPSRAGLMTSIYPARYGAENNDSSRNRPGRMPATTIASLLKAKGYATKIVGKWDLAGQQAPQPVAYMPVARGFNGFYGIPGGISSYYLKSNPPPGAWCLTDNGTPTQDFSLYNGPTHNVQEYKQGTSSYEAVSPTDYLTGRLADEAVTFINAHTGGSGDRFFLYLPFNATHVPYMAPNAYFGPASGSGAQRMYRAMITALDDNIGKVLTAVGNKSQTVQDNTMIIFISDNGNVAQGSSGPLTGGKETIYEGGIHVPFAIKWPAVFSPSQYNYPVSTLDLLPTIAKAAGYTAGQFSTDGVDLAQCVPAPSTPAHTKLCWRYVGDDANQAGDILAMLGVRNGDFKYLRHVTKGGTATEHLYDLGASLVESGNDLIGNSSYATQKAACISALNNWNKQNPLEERFGNLAYGFVPYYAQSGGTWSLVGQEYKIAGGHAGDRSIVETTYFEDATFQVNARLTTTGKAGLIFRSTNHTAGGNFTFNGYYAQIESDNHVSLYRVDNGSQALLGTATKTINVGTTYALKVVTAGANIKVYVGSTKHLDVNDSAYAGGSVGVRLGTPTPTSTSTAVFDDLVVTP